MKLNNLIEVVAATPELDGITGDVIPLSVLLDIRRGFDRFGLNDCGVVEGGFEVDSRFGSKLKVPIEFATHEDERVLDYFLKRGNIPVHLAHMFHELVHVVQNGQRSCFRKLLGIKQGLFLLVGEIHAFLAEGAISMGVNDKDILREGALIKCIKEKYAFLLRDFDDRDVDQILEVLIKQCASLMNDGCTHAELANAVAKVNNVSRYTGADTFNDMLGRASWTTLGDPIDELRRKRLDFSKTLVNVCRTC